MNLRFETKDNVTIIFFDGKLDVQTSIKIEAQLMDIINDTKKHMYIVDLENLSFLTSSGIRIFIRAFKEITILEGKFIFSNVPEKIERIIRMVELDSLFGINTICKGNDEAIQQLTVKG